MEQVLGLMRFQKWTWKETLRMPVSWRHAMLAYVTKSKPTLEEAFESGALGESDSGGATRVKGIPQAKGKPYREPSIKAPKV